MLVQSVVVGDVHCVVRVSRQLVRVAVLRLYPRRRPHLFTSSKPSRSFMCSSFGRSIQPASIQDFVKRCGAEEEG